MSRAASRILTFALSCAAVCALGMARDTGVSAKLHPWGRFRPGAWKTVRVVTETLDDQGHVVSTSTTDTKTTLVDIDEDSVTLEIDACMEVAGKRFEAEPQSVTQGFHGESVGPNLKLDQPTDGEVAIEGQKIPCKVQHLESAAQNGKTLTTIYYSTTVAPYVLRRVSVATDPEGKRLSDTNVETIALKMPLKVQGETKNGIYVKTVYQAYQNQNINSTATTLAAVLPEVPGGVVSSSSKEVDKSGRVVRRSTLELVDYSNDPDKDRSGLFGRKRPPRHHSKPPVCYAP